MKNEGIALACAELGGVGALARALGVVPSAISQMRDGDRPVPIERCVQIIQLPGTKVTRMQLRPNDWWLIWPELAEKNPALIPLPAAATAKVA